MVQWNLHAILYPSGWTYLCLIRSGNHKCITIICTRKANTLATTKKKSVKAQPRDRFGRWVSTGANIKWRADGKNKIGIVRSALNGIAKVEERNEDGTGTGIITDVPLDTIQVLASKATIPSEAAKYEGKTDDLKTSLEDGQFKSELSAEGTKVISTPSGYKLEVKDGKDGNPLTYQLYAPNGQSLGIFAPEALAILQQMIDKGVTPEEDAPEEPKGSAPEDATEATFAVVEKDTRPFRVPPQVKQEIAAGLESGIAVFNGEDLIRAKALAYDDTVSMDDVKWIGSFFSEIEEAERLRGGFKGRKWASKILAPQTPEDMYAPEESGIEPERYDFDDEIFDFFAVSDEDTDSYALIAADYDTGAVYAWRTDGFEYLDDVDIDSFDAPMITPVDVETAIELAKYLDTSVGGSYDILNSDEEERMLFEMAEAELDFGEMDRVFTIIADATGYTPQERSINASRQKRGPGGKFGGGQATGSSVPGQVTPQFPKAKLSTELPLVENIAALIEAWLATAPEGSLTASAVFAEEEPAEAAETPVEATEAPAEASEADTEAAEALYFAIVDEVDKTAVMNAFAIIKQGGGPKAYLRENAKWAESPDVLSDIQGTTPPPVVELESPEPAKSVLAQIDQHDSTQTKEATASEDGPALVASASRGYALPDGSFAVHSVSDLVKAVEELQKTEREDAFTARDHLRKRARALNRMDIVPEEWRAASAVERGTLVASASPLFGEFGEILTAAGGRRGRRGGSAAALKRYWTVGKGALKIRWGTPGDLTRAHRHLAKYVGPERAWGLAQNYHKSLFGMTNYKRDNG